MVAPISVTRPSSTAGSSASCWALLKRWISSRKKIVRRPVCAALAGALDHLAHLGAAGVDGRELLEGGVGVLGGEARERGLAGAGRAEQDHRVRLAGLERVAQRRALAEQVLLADEAGERARAHAGGERAVAGGSATRASSGGSSGASNRRSMRGSVWSRAVAGRLAHDGAARMGPDRRRSASAARPRTSRCCASSCVERRGWIAAREFEDANAACQLLPGPGLDAAGDLLRAPGRRQRRRAGRRARVHPARAGADARDRGGRAAGRPAGLGERVRGGRRRGGRRRRRPGGDPARAARASPGATAPRLRGRSSTPGSAPPRRSRVGAVRRARAARAAAWPSCRCAAAAAPPCTPGRSRCRSRPPAPPRCPRSPGRR